MQRAACIACCTASSLQHAARFPATCDRQTDRHATARRQCRVTYECTFDRVALGLFECSLDVCLAGEVQLGVVHPASALDENIAFQEELLDPSVGDDRVIDLATVVSICFLCAMHATVRRQPGTPSARALRQPAGTVGPRSARRELPAPRGYPTEYSMYGTGRTYQCFDDILVLLEERVEDGVAQRRNRLGLQCGTGSRARAAARGRAEGSVPPPVSVGKC